LTVLTLVDALALAGAFFLAYWVRIASGIVYYGVEASPGSYYQLYLYCLPLLWLIFYSSHLYTPHELFYGTAEYVQVIKAVSYGVLAIIAVGFFQRFTASRGWLVLFWILSIYFVNLGRFGFRRLIRPRLQCGLGRDRVLIVGANEEARMIALKLIDTGLMEVVGFLDEFNPVGEEVVKKITVKGSPQNYERIAHEEGATQMILVPDAVSWETSRDILAGVMKKNKLKVFVAPGFNELYSASLRISYAGYVPLLSFQPGYSSGLSGFVKASVDWFLGVLLFILSFPVTSFLSLWILVTQGWPVFEGHEVIGRYGQPFIGYRFRTGWTRVGNRYIRLHGKSQAGPEGTEISWFQKFLLQTGLVSIPQLLNVLMGQMSIVGPRPSRRENDSEYGVGLSGLLAVKPGITGPWAIQKADNLRDETPATLVYIHSWSPLKDLQILISTLLFLIRKGRNKT